MQNNVTGSYCSNMIYPPGNFSIQIHSSHVSVRTDQ